MPAHHGVVDARLDARRLEMSFCENCKHDGELDRLNVWVCLDKQGKQVSCYCDCSRYGKKT